MKPVAFEYERAADLDEATKLLAEEGVFSKVIAGSQSLGPMLNLRLAQPDLLVDITSVPELAVISDHRDYLELGACVTHADIEDGRVPDVTNGLLRYVAGGIAYRAVRNRGTIGGSLAHADSAADWISTFPVLGADVILRSQNGERTIAAESFILSSFTTVLKSDEIIRAIRIPKCSKQARWGYYKVNQKVGEFAHAIGAVLHDPAHDRFRAVIGAIETAPIVITDASSLFGGSFDANAADRLDEVAVFNLLDAKGVKDKYARRVLLAALKRAAKQAAAS